MGSDAQLAFGVIFSGGGAVIFYGECTGQFSGVKCPGEFVLRGIFLQMGTFQGNVRGNCPGCQVGVWIYMQDHRSLHVMVMIWPTQVNTHTHTRTVFDQLYVII